MRELTPSNVLVVSARLGLGLENTGRELQSEVLQELAHQAHCYDALLCPEEVLERLVGEG